ncbi:Hypothetical predicted protein [Paramuricea clavata]|uniref:Uncharacterized protein n=1 Tax=Paramuricea clavata TaxID=317549 RepID=A0A7D9E185_PARCT|nr:Hypothetical predicted protein [Paramuricea clavata]
MHMEDTITSKLRELGIRRSDSQQYMSDIFGQRNEASSKKSLVESSSREEFVKRLEALKDTWINQHKGGEKFFNYFMKWKAEQIGNCMTAEVRSRAGLGYPPQVYTQNGNECMNSVIKRSSQNKKMDIVDCVENLRGRGELVVSEDFSDFMVDEDDFFKMTKEQQEKAFRKFCNIPLDRSDEQQSGTTDETPDANVLRFLSLQPSQSCITSIPSAILQETFSQANEILSNEQGIHKFGSDRSFYVNTI